MTERKPVATNVKRRLWAEAMGHCMNPACGKELIRCSTNIGQMAHIDPHAKGGDVSFENLLLLCSECHKLIDDNRTENTVNILKKWKKDRNIVICQNFSEQYQSFEKLKNAVVPILKRNWQIFKNYGPGSQNLNDSERHGLWLKFEPEIISNNAKLEVTLTKNKNLLHPNNKNIVENFVSHAHEFAETRDKKIPRINLFPKELLSIFGVEKAVNDNPVSNLNALQNFISHLKKENRFIELQLEPEQILKYEEEGVRCSLDLRDQPRVEQIFWTGKFYRPQITELRLGSLAFLLDWLKRNGIRYHFQDYADLTEIILDNRYRVKFFYIYCLSVSDLYEITFTPETVLINLHNWNGLNCISEEARRYASDIGVKLFTQKEFFIFAHNEIK